MRTTSSRCIESSALRILDSRFQMAWCSASGRSHARRGVFALLAIVLAAFPVAAEIAWRGSFVVTVTTQGGTIRLPGASITVGSLDGHTVTTDISDAEGRLRPFDWSAGRGRPRTSLNGAQALQIRGARFQGGEP